MKGSDKNLTISLLSFLLNKHILNKDMKQIIQNLFKKPNAKKAVIGVNLVLVNAITMQANLSGGKLKIQ